jgi:hypothetical protein
VALSIAGFAIRVSSEVSVWPARITTLVMAVAVVGPSG